MRRRVRWNSLLRKSDMKKRKFLSALLLAPFVPIHKLFSNPTTSHFGETIISYEEIAKRFTITARWKINSDLIGLAFAANNDAALANDLAPTADPNKSP